jgi:hypothetical protein
MNDLKVTKLTRKISKEYELKLGDVITAPGGDDWSPDIEGTVIYIFSSGNRVIIDKDETVVWVYKIKTINGELLGDLY